MGFFDELTVGQLESLKDAARRPGIFGDPDVI